MDQKTTLMEMKEKVRKFCDDRDWARFHNAKDLAIGVSTEAAELLEQFRFKSEEEIREMFQQDEKRDRITEEIADILFMLLRLAERYNVDIAAEFDKKMEKNEKKYPVEKAKGSNKKYTEF